MLVVLDAGDRGDAQAVGETVRDDGTSGDGVVSKQTGEEETDVHA